MEFGRDKAEPNILSPAWIQNSFGRKASAVCVKSGAWAPTEPVHSVAEAATGAAADIKVAAAIAATRLEMPLRRLCIVPLLVVELSLSFIPQRIPCKRNHLPRKC